MTNWEREKKEFVLKQNDEEEFDIQKEYMSLLKHIGLYLVVFSICTIIVYKIFN